MGLAAIGLETFDIFFSYVTKTYMGSVLTLYKKIFSKTDAIKFRKKKKIYYKPRLRRLGNGAYTSARWSVMVDRRWFEIACGRKR